MKYVCLGYMEAGKFEAMSESERNAFVDGCFAYDDELRGNGHFAGGEALQSATSAVTLRYQGGKVVVTDGPYAETKEQLGGILVLEARDLNHAIQLSPRIGARRRLPHGASQARLSALHTPENVGLRWDGVHTRLARKERRHEGAAKNPRSSEEGESAGRGLSDRTSRTPARRTSVRGSARGAPGPRGRSPPRGIAPPRSGAATTGAAAAGCAASVPCESRSWMPPFGSSLYARSVSVVCRSCNRQVTLGRAAVEERVPVAVELGLGLRDPDDGACARALFCRALGVGGAHRSAREQHSRPDYARAD
jgi:hypothetical protein